MGLFRRHPMHRFAHRRAVPPADAIRAHALHYLRALPGDLGRVQMAVLAECLAESGDSRVFVDR